MSTTKRLSVKAEKPQDQTFASKAQAITEAILDEKTTELSNAIDSSIMDSMVYGTGRVYLKPGDFAVTTTPFNGSSASINASTLHAPNLGWPRPVDLKKEMLETHPVFELTVEQLRAAWMLAYGSRWMDMSEVYADDYMDKVAARLRTLGELEVHNVIDQYAPMARVKL